MYLKKTKTKTKPHYKIEKTGPNTTSEQISITTEKLELPE